MIRRAFLLKGGLEIGIWTQPYIYYLEVLPRLVSTSRHDQKRADHEEIRNCPKPALINVEETPRSPGSELLFTLQHFDGTQDRLYSLA